MMAMPKQLDDIWYMWQMAPWFKQQGIETSITGGDPIRYGMPWSEIWSTYVYHYYGDNVRLANIFIVPLLIFPKWVGSGIAALCWIYVMWGSLKFVNIDIRKSALIPVALFLWIFTLPWRDHMGSLIFQSNYVISSALSFFLLNKLKNDSFTNVGLIGLFLLSVVVGAWHEGFSATILCGLTAVLVFCRNVSKKTLVIAIVGLSAGLLWLNLSPHLSTRYEENVFWPRGNYPEVLFRILRWQTVCAVFLAFAVTYIIKNGWRQVISDKIFVFLVSAISGGIIIFVMVHLLRSAWMGNILAISGLIYLLNKFFPRFWAQYRGWSLAIGVVLIISSGVTLFLVDKYTLKYKEIYESAFFNYAKGKNIVFFEDIQPDEQNPYVVSMFVSDRIFYNCTDNEMVLLGRKFNPDKNWLILPKELGNFEFDKAEKIPGNTNFKNVGGLLVAPYNEETKRSITLDDWIHYNIDFGPIKGRRTGMWALLFTNPRDGRKYYYVRITENRLPNSLFGITAINKAEP